VVFDAIDLIKDAIVITGGSYQLGSSENNSKGAKVPTGSDADNEI